MPDTLYGNIHSQHYDKFSIGVTTSTDREHFAYNILATLDKLYPTIPVTLIVNNPKANMTKIKQWPHRKHKVCVTSELQSFGWCQNSHALGYPERPYVVWFGDTDVFTNPYAIDNLIDCHLHGYDLVRGYFSTAMSMFKGELARIKWWDERCYNPWNDVDFGERVRRAGVKEISLDPGSIVVHLECKTKWWHTEDHPSGIGTKFNGEEFHKAKWNIDSPHIPEDAVQLMEDIDLYPEYTTKFLGMERLHESPDTPRS